jgi:hypothetical protein
LCMALPSSFSTTMFRRSPNVSSSEMRSETNFHNWEAGKHMWRSELYSTYIDLLCATLVSHSPSEKTIFL